MRISRDVVRPFVALLVIVAAIGLVTGIGAYRAETVHAQKPQADTLHTDTCDSVGVASGREDDEHEEEHEYEEGYEDHNDDRQTTSACTPSPTASSGSGGTVVTTTGAS